jgi:hypothetical protein
VLVPRASLDLKLVFLEKLKRVCWGDFLDPPSLPYRMMKKKEKKKKTLENSTSSNEKPRESITEVRSQTNLLQRNMLTKLK